MSEKQGNPMSLIPNNAKSKLAVMVICIAVLVGGMSFLTNLADQKDPAKGQAADQAAKPGDNPEAAAPADEKTEALENLQDDPSFGELGDAEATQDSEAGDNDIFDMSLLKDINTDGMSFLPPVGLVLLLHEAQQNTFEQIKSETDDSVSLESIMKSPAENRGKVLYVEGSLTKAVKKKMWANAADIDYVYDCTIECPQIDKDTQKIRVFLLDGPLGSKLGETVALRGYFLSLWKNDDGQVMPILVGRRFDPPEWLTDQKSLENVYDGDFNREYKAVYYLMHKLSGMTSEEIHEAVDPKIKPVDLANAPAKNRGKFISVIGTIIQLRVQKLDPNATGISKCYTGFILDPNDNQYNFYLLDRPKGLKENDLARLDGVFMKNYRYITRKSVEEVAPVVVARTLAPVKVNTSKVGLQTLAICALVLLVVGIAAIIEIRATRRRSEESHQKLMKRMPKDIGNKAREMSRKMRRESHE